MLSVYDLVEKLDYGCPIDCVLYVYLDDRRGPLIAIETRQFRTHATEGLP